VLRMSRERCCLSRFAQRAALPMHRGMSEPVYSPVLPETELADGMTRLVTVDGRELLLCRDEEQVYAIENRCSHMDAPLDCGRVKWGWIACPAHGARFDLATGEAVGRPATASIRIWPVRLTDGMIEVAL
jgi:3-phenylpropionate/trans-cinnamate dioxygenase ferredoxin component